MNIKTKGAVMAFVLMSSLSNASNLYAEQVITQVSPRSAVVADKDSCLPLGFAPTYENKPFADSSPMWLKDARVKYNWPAITAEQAIKCKEAQDFINAVVYRTAKNGTKLDRPVRELDAITKDKETRVKVGVICGDLVKINRGYRWHKVLNDTKTAVCK